MTATANPTHPLTLYTFAMSHYSEKVRWTLDISDIPYREVCLSPAFHIAPALRMGQRGQTTLPILQSASESVQDSPRILSWLQTHRGPLAVMPHALDRQVRAVELMARHADLEATSAADGYNPLLEDFKNTSVLMTDWGDQEAA